MPDTRLSRAGDKGALTELWQAVFGDSAELISAFFSLLCRPEYCRIACAGGKIASMGFCLPGPEAMGLKCAYIYAMATAEDARGRGLAAAVGSALIEDAFESGTDIVATLPADEGLWYRCFLQQLLSYGALSPQTASRLEGEYRVLPFYGEDIRLLRKQRL